MRRKPNENKWRSLERRVKKLKKGWKRLRKRIKRENLWRDKRKSMTESSNASCGLCMILMPLKKRGISARVSVSLYYPRLSELRI